MEQAGSFAYLMLLLVVPGSIVAFAVLRPLQAVLVILLGGLMFLPERVNFDAPLIPPLGKESIPAMCALLGVLITSRDRLKQARWGRGVDLLIILGLLGAIGTTQTNKDALTYGTTSLPGLATGDLLSQIVALALGPFSRFFIGRVMFRTADDARTLLRALVIAALIYWPLMLVEVRLSPQLHNWIYGFNPGDFAQSVRGGGYRPQCFMSHGLLLAMFIWCGIIAAWTLAKARVQLFGFPVGFLGAGFLFAFPLIRSVAALGYALLVVPIGWFLRPRSQIRFAAVLAAVVILYPAIRASGAFPREAIVDYAARATNQDRAQSLDFRFLHEEALLEKALERPWFGWGSWGRNRVFDEWGYDLSVTDGEWVMAIGSGGAVGFLSYFGLLVVPIFMALRNVKRVAPKDQPLLAGFAMMAGVCALDLLPNSSFQAHLGMFLAGVTAGLAQGMPLEVRKRGLDPALARRLLSALRRAGLVPAARA